MLDKGVKLDSLKTAVSIVKEYASSADAGKYWDIIPDLLKKTYTKLNELREDVDAQDK